MKNNKKALIEKLFDATIKANDLQLFWCKENQEVQEDEIKIVKAFIDTVVIPSVLREVLPEKKYTQDQSFEDERIFGFNRCRDFIKQRAKEAFNVEL